MEMNPQTSSTRPPVYPDKIKSMTTQDKITLLSQIQGITDANLTILAVARTNPDQAERIKKAAQHLLDACDIINQIGADPMPNYTNA